MAPSMLSDRSRIILEAIAAGRSYDQILASDLATSYPEIFQAAAEALAVAVAAGNMDSTAYHKRMEKIRGEHPRAYEKWLPEEDGELADLFNAGSSVMEISTTLQRQPSAIRRRLEKLGVVADIGDGADPPDAAV